ncbi:hypothetical protein [Alphaproteobacteria bacterium endosymbiont of Tiliacea citrago]|uniref:hypothetical protein n=1 Tax=Alphaproteobacteria bacterium endosymbiont of Tiliacea citrago TaxID=3077944 RepID=UPI00313CC31A
MRFKFFIFFLFFFSNSKILFYTNADLGMSFLDYNNFKLGFSLGIKSFDEKFNFKKKLYSFGAFFDILDFFSIKSFYVGSNVLLEIHDLQKIKYIGLNCLVSFRTWDFPINIGVICTYSKFRPNLSFGAIVSFNYYIKKMNINLGSALLYSKTKNFNEIFSFSIPEYSFLNELDQDLLNIIIKNKNNLQDNDEYFEENTKLFKIEKDLHETIQKIQKIANSKKIEKQNCKKQLILMKDFEKQINLLITSLKTLYKIAVNTNLVFDFFSTNQINNLEKYLEKVRNKIENANDDFANFNYSFEEECLKNYKSDNIEKYLKNKILEAFLIFSYYIEIKASFLPNEEEEKSNSVLFKLKGFLFK